MNRLSPDTSLQNEIETLPAELRSLLLQNPIYDTSGHSGARVLFIEKDGGYFLKSAPKETLAKEALLTRYFHEKGLGAEVLAYISEEKDYLLTPRVPGKDATDPVWTANPEKLCDTLALFLRELHSLPVSDCPVQDRTAEYIRTAKQNYLAGTYDTSHFPDSFGYASAEEAMNVIDKNTHLLKSDTLIHGDYCLPNIILKDFHPSGLIDLGNSGVSDRHIDLFWGIWSLEFNLKTDAYRERFLDAYGREALEPEMLKIIAAFEVFG